MAEHWLILGASSPIARAFVRAVAARGDAVTLAGRDLQELSESAGDARLRGATVARALQCEATDADSIQRLLEVADIAGFDLNVLLAMGSMPEQSAMDSDPQLLERMIRSTFMGPVALLQGLAPFFERQRKGKVVVIGSVAGDRGRRKNYLYGSAKAGLATFATGLRARLFPAGASVTLVKPGFVDTPMTWGAPGLFLVAAPEECATAILRAADRGTPEIYVPSFWRWIMLVIRHIPATVLKRLSF